MAKPSTILKRQRKKLSFLFKFKPMRGIIPCLVTIALLIGCSKQKERIPPLMSDDKGSGKIAVYQVMTRLFGNKNATNKTYGTRDENGVGKFNDIDARALKAIREMGITHAAPRAALVSERSRHRRQAVCCRRLAPPGTIAGRVAGKSGGQSAR